MRTADERWQARGGRGGGADRGRAAGGGLRLRLFPGGAPQPITQAQKEQMLKFAACIRAHGFPSYPDPQFPSGGGVMRPQNNINVGSPQFQAAAQTCNANS
jgi:hypothetical protein